MVKAANRPFEQLRLQTNGKNIFGKLGREGRDLLDYLQGQKNVSWDQSRLADLQIKLAGGAAEIVVADKTYVVTPDMVSVVSETIRSVEYHPHVLATSLRLDRITRILLHQAASRREASRHVWLSLNPRVAPYKVLILPLRKHSAYQQHVEKLAKIFRKTRLSYWVDKSSARIGVRYRRGDQMGIPFAITVDGATLNNGTVTVRERDRRQQVRMPVNMLEFELADLVFGHTTWNSVLAKFPVIAKNLKCCAASSCGCEIAS